MTLGTILVLVVFSIWFVLTIPYQFNKGFGKRLQRLNSFYILPGWTFFAPTPGTSDYRFVYRDVDANGKRNDWKEIDWCRSRSALDAVWHPHRFRQKMIVDLINTFGVTLRGMKEQGTDIDENPQIWMMSTPYMNLLHIVMLMPLETQTRSRQFAIIEQKRWAPAQPPTLVVCSSAHDVEAA
jgi:hypothetical protein